MSASKRNAVSGDNGHLSKKICTDTKLELFLEWCQSRNLVLNEKVEVTNTGVCAQYGMLAKEAISEGEVLFEIPRSLLLSPSNSSVAVLLEEESDDIRSQSGWVPLLLALMHEYSSEKSAWQPYFSLVPDFSELDLPLFWNADEIEMELKGTGVPEVVMKDTDNIEKEFTQVVLPFIKKHTDVFSAKCQSLDFYKKMVAFVMAYSFTEPISAIEDDNEDVDEGISLRDDQPLPLPMMVPMADALNHIARNNAHLDFGSDSLKMIATKNISQGEEVYNTYGELSNKNLLHMYGFAENYPLNDYDIVEISTECLLETTTEFSSHPESVEVRWKHLEAIGCLEELGETLITENQGIMNDQVLAVVMKVLHMDDDEFNCFKDKSDDGWEEDAMDESDGMFTFENISNLPAQWKSIFAKMAEKKMKTYRKDLKEEEAFRLSTQNWQAASRRQQFCSHVRYGQLQLLQALHQACQT